MYLWAPSNFLWFDQPAGQFKSWIAVPSPQFIFTEVPLSQTFPDPMSFQSEKIGVHAPHLKHGSKAQQRRGREQANRNRKSRSELKCQNAQGGRAGQDRTDCGPADFKLKLANEHGETRKNETTEYTENTEK